MENGKKLQKKKQFEKIKKGIGASVVSVVAAAVIKGVLGINISNQDTNFDDFQERDRNL